ncbi:DUF402 domain-containing protein [Planomonospora parontospora]|uniref:DUF402 domain-containing protein n=1 Tax=Planomonospora parontospora TaxID=58119 RepID=UPI0016703CC9|nr:DUF402 domain-containing protein [Planomonospora parontospora]GGL02533.1 hypothetical protein GCM10014719_00920 [Planomonospora parontospora subsp. antibiotica]GII16736.1 hypothetical protein Ppa05_34620 [Planomonospora parontospora subsp. antibiotica]
MSFETVNVTYRKYDGSLHWHHTALLLGEDEHGVWTGCVAGTLGRKGSEPPITWKHPFVLLFPRDAWWTALFNAEPDSTEIYCDITTVPEWRDGEVTMVDLDLDVIRKRDGRIFLDDEDEFAEHQVRYAYPPDVIAGARAAADHLMEAVAAFTAPFAAPPHWLSHVV